MRRYLFPLVALVLGGALIALSEFGPQQSVGNDTTAPAVNAAGNTNAEPANVNAVVNANASPTNTNVSPPTANANTNASTSSTTLPATVKLKVPFTSQAPTGNWSPEFNDACEEASALMAVLFLQGSGMPSAADTERTLLAVEDWETANLGHWESTSAAETEEFIEGYWPGITATVKPLTTMDQVRRELALGRPVILPANGRTLGNPHYRAPGPPYHMLVITGYDPQGFITNDPGTRHGKDYRYSGDTLFDATHDWEGSGVANGPKLYLVLGKE